MNDYGELLQEAKRAVVGHSSIQTLTLQVFHDQVGIPVVVAEFEHRYDIGVLQAPERLSLAKEPRQHLRMLCKSTYDHLDCYESIELRVRRLVNDSHASAPDDTEDIVLPDLGGNW